MNDDIMRRVMEAKNLPSIIVGMNVIHKTKGSIYKVTKTDDKFVYITRLGNDKSFRLRNHLFFETYNPLSKKESKQLSGAEKQLKDLGLPINAENIDLFNGDIPGIFIPYNSNDHDLIVEQNIIDEIDIAINLIQNRDKFNEIWKLENILEQANKCVLNFYGPSGTGKTLAAKYISSKIKKSIFQVRYDEIVSKFIGDTAKNIGRIFEIAKKTGSILLLDEADTLLSRRIHMSDVSDQSFVTSINQNRNVLMQEIDRFEGIMVTTTNFFDNYDPALLRRIARHIQFKLPTKTQLTLLFKKHIPNMSRVKEVNFSTLSVTAEGLSGGDVRNVCLNAMERASIDPNPANWYLTTEHLELEISSIKNSRQENVSRRNNVYSR